MLQVLYSLLEAKKRGIGPAMPTVKILFANRTTADIIMRGELEALAEEHKEIQLLHLISQEEAPSSQVKAGKISSQVLGDFVAAPGLGVQTLISGPSGFHDAALTALQELGHKMESIHEFK